MIPEIYTGGKDDFIVAHCKGATSSLKVAIRSVTPTNKQKKMLISLRLQIERLSSCKRSADLSVRKEGELPSYKGKPRKIFGLSRRFPSEGTTGNPSEFLKRSS